MRETWERWGWVVALAACALFTLRMLWGREAFCGSTDEQCMREWLSATGGWVAVGIGVPSLFALREQIKAAVKANENNAKIQLRRNYALAKKVEGVSDLIMMNATILLGQIQGKHIPLEINTNKSYAIGKIDTIIDFLQRGGFDKFEEEIEFPAPYSADSIRRIGGRLRNSIAEIGDIVLAIGPEIQVTEFCDVCKQYAEFCKTAAIAFIREADEMRGARHANALDGTEA